MTSAAAIVATTVTPHVIRAALLNAAHRPGVLVVLGAVGIFAGALKLLDSLIELARWTG